MKARAASFFIRILKSASLRYLFIRPNCLTLKSKRLLKLINERNTSRYSHWSKCTIWCIGYLPAYFRLKFIIYSIIPKCACVCLFYLKTVNSNDLILFASWRDSSRLGFKILTKNLWRYVNWLISKFVKIEIELGIFFFRYYDVVLCANHKYA